MSAANTKTSTNKQQSVNLNSDGRLNSTNPPETITQIPVDFYKPIATNSGQMFLIMRRSSSLIALLVVVISSMLTTLSPDGRGVDAGLIHIYHKYRAGKAAEAETASAANANEEPLNTSASIEQQILGDGELVDLMPETTQHLVTRSIEYTSPMKRIMELIGHHSPVIVVSSDSPQQQQQQSSGVEQQSAAGTDSGGQQQLAVSNKAAENQMATLIQTALLPASHMQPQPATSSDHQQWALLDTNQALLPSAMLAAQQQHHQQFIQASPMSPYEQYYLAPGHQLSADHATQAHHLAMLPGANLGYTPANSYQQLATLTPSYSTASEPHHHHQAAQQVAASLQAAQHSLQQSSQEERAQPVFLSSYVPEITVPAKSVIQAETSSDKHPNSIQQAVQYSHVNPQQQQQQQQQASQQPQIQAQAQPQSQVNPQSQALAQPQQVQVKVNQQTSSDTAHSGPVAQARSSSQPSESKRDSSSDADMADENDSDSGNRGGYSDEPDDGDLGGDMEEPSKMKRSHTAERQAQGSQARQLSARGDNFNKGGADGDGGGAQDEPPAGGSASGSGYMSYEDKFDSDKDEPRKVSTRHSPREAASEASNNVQNGLVNVGLNDDCLQCICRASSGCDQLLRCITRGADEKYCGPFQLTEEYWNKAGSLRDAPNNFNSFEDCANDVDCASEMVTRYMNKHKKDCDGDQLITCMDYARLHRLQPSECHNTGKLVNNFDAYWPKFQRCAEGYNRSRNGDDEEI